VCDCLLHRQVLNCWSQTWEIQEDPTQADWHCSVISFSWLFDMNLCCVIDHRASLAHYKQRKEMVWHSWDMQCILNYQDPLVSIKPTVVKDSTINNWYFLEGCKLGANALTSMERPLSQSTRQSNCCQVQPPCSHVSPGQLDMESGEPSWHWLKFQRDLQ
jgi:hypothetical protein